MPPETIDHTMLQQLADSGSIRAAQVVGQAGGWSLVVSYGTAERALAAQRSRKIRVFRRFETLVGYLKDMGIEQFSVDAASFAEPESEARSRPDRAAALRQTHAAAAHDKWFREQVEEALLAADEAGAQWVSQETIKADIARSRDGLRARLKGTNG